MRGTFANATLAFLLLVGLAVEEIHSRARGAEVILFGLTDSWRYNETSSYDQIDWTSPAFDDSALPVGAGVLAQENNSFITNLTNTILTLGQVAYYFRTHFTFEGNPAGVSLVFSNLLDDGAVFYLNGREINRLFMPSAPAVITNGTTATVAGEATAFEVFTLSGPIVETNLVTGDNVLAVEVHQNSVDSSDVVFGLALSANLPPVPCGPLSIIMIGSSATLTWDGPCRLQSADSLSGAVNWQDVPGSSPLTLPASGGARFFRTFSQDDGSCSPNIVGYVNLNLPSGSSLIANPLNGTDNHLDTILPAPPDGTVVRRFDPNTQTNREDIIFIAGFGWFSNDQTEDYTLNPGEGFLIFNPAAPLVVTFVGEVPQGNLFNSLPVNTSYRSSIAPISGPISSALGFPAQDGDTLALYNSASQSFGTPFTYVGGAWDPSEPVIPVGTGFRLQRSGEGNWVQSFNPSDCGPQVPFVVTSTDDSGPNTLRQAILDANERPGSDTITFAIPGAGPHTIAPTSELPLITDSVVIDGYTQPGASPNELSTGNNAVLLIELSGENAGDASGLTLLFSSGCTVRGLVINRFSREGIFVSFDCQDTIIAGNFIGTDTSGTEVLPNFNGINVQFSTRTTIGGTSAGARNVISGNEGEGIIFVLDGGPNVIEGNFIGTDKFGTSGLGSGSGGITLLSSANTTVGGTAPGAGNLISGQSQGIRIINVESSNNVVQGNFIGTDVTGTQRLGDQANGVSLIDSPGNLIGGTVAGAANVISGNAYGVTLLISNATGNVVQGNLIGTDVTGTAPIPNYVGIFLQQAAHDNLIGGIGANAGNTIAFNQWGVEIYEEAATGAVAGNRVLGNSFFANTNAAINLSIGSFDNFRPNDPADEDIGPNRLQNFPVLLQAVVENGSPTLTISYAVDSAPANSSYPLTIEFFATDGNSRQGRVYLGSDTYLAAQAGQPKLAGILDESIRPGQQISATATDADGNTSEFAVPLTVLEANQAPVLTAIGDRSATEGVPLAFTATATDPDVPANGLTFTLGGGAPAGASITAGGNFTWTPSEAQGPGVYGVTFVVSDNGVPVLSDSETIQITVSEVNTPPLVSVPTNSVSVTEGNLLSFSASGSDNDLPAQTLTFSLAAGAPAGAAITAGGAFTWTPTEAQGPFTTVVGIVVTDNGAPNLTATQLVTLTVLEANSAPVLAAIGDRSASEGVPLAFTATASDPDVPANGLIFTLGSGAPAGASITAGGNFTWTPSEAQGPGVYGVTFVVSDNGVPVLSDSETIQITVSEVNTPPLVSVPTNSVSVSEGNLLSFSASGSDNDLPAQTLTFSLAAGAPAGAAITAGGAFTWTPTEAQGPFTTVVGIVVTDNGAPNLTATQLVTLAVLEVNSAPVLTAIGNKSVLQGQTLSFTLSATDADVPANVLTYSMSGAPGGAMLNTDTGAFSWVATNTGTFDVTFGVQDNGVPIRTDSEAIQIVVTATNTAPSITAQPASLTVTNGGSAVFSVSATGTAPLAYQWRFNGGNLSGETSASLTINSAAPTSAGAYTVLIANTAGSITSAVATLTVVPPTAVLESYSLDLPAGYSLIANQLHQGNNVISSVLPVVPNGTTLLKWNGASQAFTVETYLGGVGWQPGTTTLAPGEGAFINLPSPQTLVFAGEARPPTLPLNLFAGLNLVSRQIPRPGSFEEITGRSPVEGVIVDQYRPATGDYRTQVFLDGQWRDRVPAASVGEAVWVSQFTRPSITGQPVPQTSATPGSTINFAVAVTGTPPLRYQWQRNGVSIADATNASYTINNAQILDSGIYTAAVQPGRLTPPTPQPGQPEDLPGALISAPAALRFVTTDFPFSDAFGARPVLTTNAATLTGNNAAASVEAGEPSIAGKPGGHSVWLAWMAPANGIVTFITLGSSFDTLLAAYSGSGFPGAEVASDDDGGAFLSSRITFNATAGQIYNIAVDGFGSGAGNFVLSWNLEVTAEQVPTILTQPQNQLVSLNGSAQFTVEAIGANLTYQWFRDGLAVGGATASNLVINPVQPSHVGVYVVQVNSGARFVLSQPAQLQIVSATEEEALALDKFQDVVFAATNNNALVALPAKAARKVVAHGFSGTQIFSSVGSSKEADEPNHCGVRGGKSEWFSYQPTNNGTLKVDTDGSNFDTVLAVYVGPGDSFLTLTNVACDNDSGTNGTASSVLFNVTSNAIYYIAIDGVNNPGTGVAASGRIQLNYRLVLPLVLTSLNYSSSNNNGRVIFKITGTPGVAATVQSASSLSAPTWTSLFTNTAANGSFTYTNTNALTFPHRFYRVIHQF